MYMKKRPVNVFHSYCMDDKVWEVVGQYDSYGEFKAMIEEHCRTHMLPSDEMLAVTDAKTQAVLYYVKNVGGVLIFEAAPGLNDPLDL
jgi:hypothetical protein